MYRHFIACFGGVRNAFVLVLGDRDKRYGSRGPSSANEYVGNERFGRATPGSVRNRFVGQART